MSERSELCAVPSAREERRGPAGAARRIASRPVLSLGYFSLHEQREVTRSCEAGVKALLQAPAFMLCLWISRLSAGHGSLGRRSGRPWGAQAMAEAESGTFAPLRGASHLLCSCKETWPKEALFNSRMAGQHAPASALSVPAALRVHSTAGIFRRDPAAMQLGPGQSPHGASPLIGAKQCFTCFRFAPVSSKNDVLARFAAESGAGAVRRPPVRRGEAVLRPFSAEPMHVAPAGSCLSAPSLRKGTRKSNAKAKTKSRQRQQQQASG